MCLPNVFTPFIYLLSFVHASLLVVSTAIVLSLCTSGDATELEWTNSVQLRCSLRINRRLLLQNVRCFEVVWQSLHRQIARYCCSPMVAQQATQMNWNELNWTASACSTWCNSKVGLQAAMSNATQMNCIGLRRPSPLLANLELAIGVESRCKQLRWNKIICELCVT